MMRKANVMTMFMLCLLTLVHRQVAATVEQPLTHLEITYNKTSTLVLPGNIHKVDRGSRGIMAEKVEGLDNVLKLKAAYTRFEETNLTVYLDCGIYHFMVSYSQAPARYIWQVPDRQDIKQVMFSRLTPTQMDRYAKWMVREDRKLPPRHTSTQGIKVSLRNVYVRGEVMFYHLRYENTSNIDYTPELVRFFVKDKKQVRRTAYQELEKRPLHVKGYDRKIKAGMAADVIYVLDKFTIPQSKYLVVEVMEKAGARHLALKIKSKHLMKARRLP